MARKKLTNEIAKKAIDEYAIQVKTFLSELEGCIGLDDLIAARVRASNMAFNANECERRVQEWISLNLELDEEY